MSTFNISLISLLTKEPKPPNTFVHLAAASPLLIVPSASSVCTSTVSFFHWVSLLVSFPIAFNALIRLSQASVMLLPRSVLMELSSSLSTSAFKETLPLTEVSVTPLGLLLLLSLCSSTVASLSILLYKKAAATFTLEFCAALSVCLFNWPVTVWEKDFMLVTASTVTSPPPATGFPSSSFLTAFSSTPGVTVTLAVLVLSTTATEAPAVTYCNALLKAFSSPCSLPPCRNPSAPIFVLSVLAKALTLDSPATLNSTMGSTPSPILLSALIPREST